MKIQTQANYKYKGGHQMDQESMTIPNQSYSVREILQRFQAGTLANISKPIYYELEDDSDDFDNVDITQSPDFDLVDAENYLHAINSKLSEDETEREHSVDSSEDTHDNKKDETSNKVENERSGDGDDK